MALGLYPNKLTQSIGATDEEKCGRRLQRPGNATEHGRGITEIVAEQFAKSGTAAFSMPRELAVCHESGHAVVGAANGVTVKRVEVISQTAIQLFKKERGRNPRNCERQRLIAAGCSLHRKNWGGLTTWGTTPWDDLDPVHANAATFSDAIQILIGGICGECVLYPVIYGGEVPEGSSPR